MNNLRGHPVKIIKPYMTDELLAFKNEASQCRARHEKPWNPQRFFMTMATGNYKLHPHEINELVSTYDFYALHEDSENRALITSSIAGACADSQVDESNSDALSHFLSEAVKAVCGLKKLNDVSTLNSMTKSIHKLVRKHLPSLNVPALGIYLLNSRKLTHLADPEFSEMAVHAATAVLDHPALSNPKVKANQALVSIIEHFFDSDKRTYGDEEFDFNRVVERRYGDGIAKLTAMATLFIKLADGEHYMPVKYPDLAVVGTLVDRFEIAAASAPSGEEHEFFSRATASLTALCINFPKNKMSKDHNLFLRDTSGFEWIERAPCKEIEPAFLGLLPSFGVFSEATDTALRAFYWSILKNALRVHTKQVESSFNNSGYDNSGLVRGLSQNCMPMILDQKNLEKLGPAEIGILISCVDEPETKRLLLSRNKESRGCVLMDSLGL
jgi:hypothetical protein